MNRYAEADTYVQAGDWLVDTVRRKPEALLLLAAGCALLMRNGRGRSSASVRQRAYRDAGATMSTASAAAKDARNRAGELKDRMAETASSYASSAADMTSRVADAASSYAGSMAEYTKRSVSEGSTRLAAQAQSTLQMTSESVRDQPLLVAAMGLAVGAAVAALFPATEFERRTLGEAREAIADAAAKAGENLVGAAGQATERLKAEATERGLHPEGLKELARDVTETFTAAATGKAEEKAGSRSTQQSREGADDQSRS